MLQLLRLLVLPPVRLRGVGADVQRGVLSSGPVDGFVPTHEDANVGLHFVPGLHHDE